MFNLPNLMTASNMLCGTVAIILMFSGRLDLAPLAIFVGVLFYFLDGFVARRMGLSSEFGKQMDSLADMVTFGIAPGLMVLQVIIVGIYLDGPHYGMSFHEYAHFQTNNWMNAVFHGVPNSMDASIKYLPFFGLIIPFFSIFRLAKFNLDERQSESFIGLPTPLNTLFFCFFPLILTWKFDQFTDLDNWITFLLDPHVVSIITVIMSLLLVSEIELFSLKFKTLGWQENNVRYIFLISCSLLIAVFLVWSIPLIVLLYLIISMLHKKSKSNPNEIQS